MRPDEYKRIRDRYKSEEFRKKTIILGDEYPNRLFILSPRAYYEVIGEHSCTHRIVEIWKGGPINYYGGNGAKIKRSSAFNLINTGELKYVNCSDEIKDAITFIKNNVHYYQIFSSSEFMQFIRDLRSANLNINDLSNIVEISKIGMFGDFSIEGVFRLKMKYIRYISDLYTQFPQKLMYISHLNDRIVPVLHLFPDASKERVCKLLNVDPWYLPSNLPESERRRTYEYYVDELGCDYGVEQLYKDYLRLREQIKQLAPNTNSPRYPSLEKLRPLHNRFVDIANKERDRLQALQNAEKQKKYEETYYPEAKKLEYSNDTYSIIACKDLQDLVREGRLLCHCVGSYINSVSEGREFILFCRKKNDINTPFFTIDVTDRYVRQIHGSHNCNVTKELQPFINEWGKKYNLDTSHCSGVLCALR